MKKLISLMIVANFLFPITVFGQSPWDSFGNDKNKDLIPTVTPKQYQIQTQNSGTPITTSPIEKTSEVVLNGKANPVWNKQWGFSHSNGEGVLSKNDQKRFDPVNSKQDRDYLIQKILKNEITPYLSSCGQGDNQILEDTKCNLGNLNRKRTSDETVISRQDDIFGVRGFGKESVYCTECEDVKARLKIPGGDESFNQFKAVLEKSYAAQKVEDWSMRLSQLHSQISLMKKDLPDQIMNDEGKVVSKVEAIADLENSCHTNHVEKQIDSSLAELVKKYDNKKDACPNLAKLAKYGIFGLGILSKKKIRDQVKLDKSNDSKANKVLKANAFNLKNELPGIEHAGEFSRDANGDIDPKRFCMANDFVDRAFFKFDQFALYNLFVEVNKPVNETAESRKLKFLDLALIAIRKDPRYAMIDVASESQDLENNLGKIYDDVIAKTHSFEKEVRPDAFSRQTLDKEVREALGNAIEGSGVNAKLSFEKTLMKKNFASIKGECKSLYSDNLEALVCKSDSLDPTDIELVMELQPAVVLCSKNENDSSLPGLLAQFNMSKDDRTTLCQNFNRLQCTSGVKGYKDEKQAFRNTLGGLHKKVGATEDKSFARQEEMEKETKGEYLSCNGLASACINDSKLGIKDYSNEEAINNAIYTCVKGKMIDGFTEYKKKKSNFNFSELKKSGKTASPFWEYFALGEIARGSNCDSFTGEDKRLCKSHEPKLGSPKIDYSECINCGYAKGSSSGNRGPDFLITDDDEVKPDLNKGKNGMNIASVNNVTNPVSDNSSKEVTDNQIQSSTPQQLVNTVAPQIVNNLETKIKAVGDEIKQKQITAENKGVMVEEDADYQKKLAQKEALENQLKDLQSSIANATNAKDKKTIEDLRSELADSKELVKKYQGKPNVAQKKVAANTQTYDDELSNFDPNSNSMNNSNGVSSGSVPSSPSTASSSNNGSGILARPGSTQGNFGASPGSLAAGFSGSNNLSGNSPTFKGGGAEHGLGVNGFVRNLSNSDIKKLEQETDLPILVIKFEDIKQMNSNPNFVQQNCPRCFEKGYFKVEIREEGQVKNVAYLSVYKQGTKNLISEDKPKVKKEEKDGRQFASEIKVKKQEFTVKELNEKLKN
ncbi:MAG: hypothetical protein ACOYL6_12115 [Bacteriovoracaceae bacterium]